MTNKTAVVVTRRDGQHWFSASSPIPRHPAVTPGRGRDRLQLYGRVGERPWARGGARRIRRGRQPGVPHQPQGRRFGLNLTEADYCFLCDPWWSPAAEAQAVDRAHRIGQTRPVTVYRLVSSGTIEEKVVACSSASVNCSLP
ncbi:helicase conserved C-terminal domain protein [Mycobacterium xenopi 3993]|nr:helicase conserved C-terminal domain protein [Mycobacterium xenopi 3993]